MSDNPGSAGHERESVAGALAGRRSIIKFKADRPAASVVRSLLDAAVRAPNHHLTEPWRFFVLAGAARERFGDAWAEAVESHLALPAGPARDARIEAERRKPLRSPVLVVVACVHAESGKALPVEDLEATAAAVQNLLLAAHAAGLAASWRTGTAAYDDGVKRHLGLRPEDEIVAFVYLGYASTEPPPLTPRRAVAEVSEWRGWDDAPPA